RILLDCSDGQSLCVVVFNRSAMDDPAVCSSFSRRRNAKRPAEKMIGNGTAPAVAHFKLLAHGIGRERSHGAAEDRVHRAGNSARSEEHTSELQSHLNLVCRLLL